MSELPNEILEMMDLYTSEGERPTLSNRDMASILTDYTLGLTGLVNTDNLFLPTNIKNLQSLTKEKYLRSHIEGFIARSEAEYKLKIERLDW